jgi:acyl-ACP thioesterase
VSNIHVDNYEITSYHVDFKQRLTPVSLLCFLQESAWKHAQSRGFGWHDLALKQEFWILAKLHLIIHRMPEWRETIRLETWGKQPELLTAFRDFELFDGNKTSVITATSSWHILDMQNHKPVSMESFLGKFPIDPNRHAIEQKPEKIRLSDNHSTAGKLFTVKPSDIDMNQHVNNTRYVQWAMDRIPFEFQQTHVLREISVNFISESRIGEECYIETSMEKDNIFLQAVIRKEDNRKLSLIKSYWVAGEQKTVLVST